MARQELAHYLRDRRAALRPHEIGLAATGTDRRTPGLRREEVAELAHMSVDYSDRYPHDPQLAALLAELHAGSAEFRQIWQARPVHAPGHRTKTLDHPEAGALRLNCDVLLVPEDDQEVVLITADSGSPSARALRRPAGQTT